MSWPIYSQTESQLGAVGSFQVNLIFYTTPVAWTPGLMLDTPAQAGGKHGGTVTYL